jgi:hypothetical protein
MNNIELDHRTFPPRVEVDLLLIPVDELTHILIEAGKNKLQ